MQGNALISMAEGATLNISDRIGVRHSIAAVRVRMKILQGIALILMAGGATLNISVRLEVRHLITVVGVRIKFCKSSPLF